MEIKIEDIRIIQVIGWRNEETGKLNIIGEDVVDDWPAEIQIAEFPDYIFMLEETDDGFDIIEDGERYELAEYSLMQKEM